jgi:hypothetical protein
MIPGGLNAARERSAEREHCRTRQFQSALGMLERGGILSVDESKPQAKD